MDLVFYNFLDVLRHEKDIKQNFGVLRYNCKYASPANMTCIENYFHQAEIFYLGDMDKVSEELYNNVLTQKELGEIKFKPLQLGEYIAKGLNHFFTIYHDEMVYNVGGVGFSNIENEVEKLIDKLRREVKDRSDKYHLKYTKEVKKIRAKRCKVVYRILGLIGAPTLIAYFLSAGYAQVHTAISQKVFNQNNNVHVAMSDVKI